MAVSRISGTGTPVDLRAKRTLSESDRSAALAEKDSNARISAANQRVIDAQREAETRIDLVKDQFSQRSEAEEQRTESRYAQVKTEGEELISRLRREQQQEISRIQREGEREKKLSETYYRDALYANDRKGRQDLDEIRMKNAQLIEHENRQTQADQESVGGEHRKRMNELTALQQHEYEQMNEQVKALRAKNEEDNVGSLDAEKARFSAQYEGTVKQHQSVLDQVNKKATERIGEIRNDTTRKLDAYESRQSDPFYQLVEIRAELDETHDAYVLVADVPVHERPHLAIHVRGDELIISGQRRNEEKKQNEDGTQVSSASFQTYSRSFKLKYPVDARELQREFQGDSLVVTLPKRTAYTYQMHKKPVVERIRVERPDFPGHLPLEENPVAVTQEKSDKPLG